MLNIFQKVSSALERHAIQIGRARAREALLGQNDRLLSDAGISRELLEIGVAAWPWQIEDSTVTMPIQTRAETPAEQDSVALAKAIEELSAYTDKELSDIGVVRSNIPSAVRFGRPGIDSPASDYADVEETKRVA